MATSRSFTTDTPPQRLYLDTDFIIASLVATEPHHVRSRVFVERLQAAGLTTIYLSSYSWVEYAHVVTREKFRARLGEDFTQRFKLGQWNDDPQVRRRYMEHFTGLLGTMLSPFRRAHIGMNATVAGRALGYMAENNAQGGDALHLASMNSADVADLASFDAAFCRVKELYLWNDGVHPPLAAEPASHPPQ